MITYKWNFLDCIWDLKVKGLKQSLRFVASPLKLVPHIGYPLSVAFLEELIEVLLIDYDYEI